MDETLRAKSAPGTTTAQGSGIRPVPLPPSREPGVLVHVWRYSGPVDELAFQDALADLSARHEILRASRPVVASVRYLALPAQRGYREFFGRQLAAAAMAEPFDGDEAPVRVSLVRFEKAAGIIILAVRSAAVDSWSAQVLMRDLAAFYAVRRAGEGESGLPELLAWDRPGVPDPAEFDWWRRRLAGARAFGLCPQPPATVDPDLSPYGAYRFELGPETVRGIRRLAAQTAGTPETVLLTAFSLFAAEYGGASDVTILAPSAGRRDPRCRDAVGSFANLFALRTDLSGAGTFREALVSTRAALRAALEHEIPFAAVPSAAPGLFDVGDLVVPVFELVQSPLPGQAGKAADLTYAEEHAVPVQDEDGPELSGGMRWRLALIGPREGVGTVEYPRSGFSGEAVSGLVVAFQRILDRSLAE